MKRMLVVLAALALVTAGSATATQLGGRKQAVRPPSTRIPSTATHVDVTLQFTDAPTIHRVITGQVAAKLVRQLNTYKPNQTQTHGCPPGAPGSTSGVLTLDLRSGPAGPLLARVKVYVLPGQRGRDGDGGCSPVFLSVAGRRQPALASNSFVPEMSGLVGVGFS
jgi:hypothetical protein